MKDAKRFILAGNAYFTIENNKGEHYTFRVRKPEEGPLAGLDAYFIGVLSGPDNTKDYTYMGLLDAREGVIRQTKKSAVSTEATSWKVAQWVVKRVWGNIPFPDGYKLHHEGRCGRCGRLLTVPESVEHGIGPECAKFMGFSLTPEEPDKVAKYETTQIKGV